MSSGHNIILKYHGNLKNIYVLKNKIKKPCEMNSKN